MKQKKKGFDVGTKVRRISREMFLGKLPSSKTMRNRKKFHKGSRKKDRRANLRDLDSSFLLSLYFTCLMARRA